MFAFPLASRPKEQTTPGMLGLAVSDNELVSEARAGSTEAFDELVSRHQERVFALAYRVLGNADDAADVQQESFVRAWSRLRRFEGRSSFATWLHAIAVNLCLERKRASCRRGVSVELDESHCPVGDCSDGVAISITVREVLREMPPYQRALLVLREVEERSVEEVAEVVGRPTPTVRTQLHRARKLFRELLWSHLGEDVQ